MFRVDQRERSVVQERRFRCASMTSYDPARSVVERCSCIEDVCSISDSLERPISLCLLVGSKAERTSLRKRISDVGLDRSSERVREGAMDTRRRSVRPVEKLVVIDSPRIRDETALRFCISPDQTFI